MDRVQVVIIGEGSSVVLSLAGRISSGADAEARNDDELAKQRGNSFRRLLSERFAEGPPLP